MRRQRSCYTLSNANCNDGREADQGEVEESTNNLNLSLANPISNALLNWTTYCNAEFTHQGRYNRMFNCEDYRSYNANETPFNLNSNLLNNYLNFQSNIYADYGTWYPSNYELFGNAMGDPSDYSSNGIMRLPQNVGNTYYHQGQKSLQGLKSNEGEGGLPSPPLLLPEPSKFSESPFGTIFIVLPNSIRIDINAAGNVYVTNQPSQCVAVLNLTDDENCIIHPNGKIIREGHTINMQSDNKFAKICGKGVVFTAATHVLRYLVDASGTKSTSEKIQDLSGDFSFDMFFGNKRASNHWQNDNTCYKLMTRTKFKDFNDGKKMWIVGGIRIKQDKFGEVSIAANDGQLVLKTSAAINTMSITSPTYIMSISCHPFQHFYVRKGSKIITVGKRFMSIHNGSQRAGFDKSNRLVLH